MENKLTIEDTWETEECLRLIRKEQNASNRKKKAKKIAGPGGNEQDEMMMMMNEQMVHCVLAQRIPKTLTQNSFSGGEKVENIGALAGFSFNISLRPSFSFWSMIMLPKPKRIEKLGRKNFGDNLISLHKSERSWGSLPIRKFFGMGPQRQ